MSMMEWAKREVEIACKKERANSEEENEWDYGCACYESALKAFNSLLEDGHSGYSIGLTQSILNRLIDGKPLTPIEDTDDIWNECSYGKEGVVASYQCKRMSSLFKDVYEDGHVEYHDNDRIICIDRYDNNDQYYNSFISRIIDKMFPITIPYIPANKPIRVYCEDLLTDPKNGDYDSKGIIYIAMPDDFEIDVNRYFKEGDSETGLVEISQEEWEERKRMDFERRAAMNKEG